MLHVGQAVFFRSLASSKGNCSLRDLPSLETLVCLKESFVAMTDLVVVGVRDGQDGIEWYNWKR